MFLLLDASILYSAYATHSTHLLKDNLKQNKLTSDLSQNGKTSSFIQLQLETQSQEGETSLESVSNTEVMKLESKLKNLFKSELMQKRRVININNT